MKTNINYSIFVFYNKSIFILIYMNNFFIINKDLNIINSFKNKLCEYFHKTDFWSVSYYLDNFVT